MEYVLRLSCKRHHTRTIDVTESEVFSLTAQRQFDTYMGKPCKTCGRPISSMSIPAVEFNERTLALWLYNPDNIYSPQDEELILAQPEYLPLLLQGIDTKDALPSKRSTLLEALCVLVYDNTPSDMRGNSPFEKPSDNIPPEETDEAIRVAVLEELRGRANLVRELQIHMNSVYVNAVVFPMIGLEW
jgi:hypothetical protein